MRRSSRTICGRIRFSTSLCPMLIWFDTLFSTRRMFNHNTVQGENGEDEDEDDLDDDEDDDDGDEDAGDDDGRCT